MGLSNELETIVFGFKRDIGGIIPQIVVSEEHSDELVITDYPVDRGASIADHAFVKPAVIRCQFGWSESATLVNSALASIKKAYKADGGLLANGNDILKGIESTEDVYQQLLELQSSRVPFSLTTKKRKYKNVVIESIKTTSTSETENALIVDITFREVLLANTVTVDLKPKNPKRVGKKVNQGSKEVRKHG